MRKQIEGYEGYYDIDENGNVYSVSRIMMVGCPKYGKKPARLRERILKHNIGKVGYPTVGLRKDGKTTTILVHRLLAKAFLPNPHNKAEVNHKDGNRANNTLSNLEWVSPKENMVHKYKVLGYKHSKETIEKIISHKRIKVVDTTTGRVFNSIYHASKELKLSRSHLVSQLNGKIKNTTTLIKQEMTL